MDFQAALEYIHGFDDPYKAALRDHGNQTWGLSRIAELLEKLDNPHLAYPVIHVAGTKGKGSTCALIAQGLIESGLKTGLYISPHLEDWRERIQIDRALISEADLASLVTDFEAVVASPTGLSEFEVTTALAFLHFKREVCEVGVIEVGLGGRLDATNVVQPLVSVITNISYDHMQFLGNTLTEIAGEKAAIIKDQIPVVSAPQGAEVLKVIEDRTRITNSQLTLISRDMMFEADQESIHGSKIRIGTPENLSTVNLRLPGVFQHENAAVAFATLCVARQRGLAVTNDAIFEGLETAEWPGRMEVMSERPITVIDSAHTPYSVGELITSLKETVDGPNWTFVFGCMADKDIRGMLIQILPVVNRLILTQAENERAASPDKLLEFALDVITELDITSKQLQIVLTQTIVGAIETAMSETSKANMICITGSLMIAGSARTTLRGRIAHELH